MSATTGFVHPEFLIETDALERRLNDPGLRIFDCTIHLIPNPDIGYTVKPGREDFENGHIPARNLSICRQTYRPHTRNCGSCYLAPRRSRRRWVALASAKIVAWSSTVRRRRSGRAASGGCCATTVLTTPRCSTADFRNGPAKAVRSRPVRRAHDRRRPLSCGPTGGLSSARRRCSLRSETARSAPSTR